MEQQELTVASPLSQLHLAFWRAKWWVGLALIVGAFAGFLRVVFTPPTYSAVSIVELQGINESFMGMNQLDPQAGTGVYANSITNLQTQIRIVLGSAIRGRAAERVHLEMPPITSVPKDVYSKLRVRLGVVKDEPTEIMKTAVKEAVTSTRVRSLGASRLLELSCESSSPEVASSFINILASEYVSHNLQSRSANAIRTSQWLEGQIDQAKARVEQADATLNEFVRKEGMVFLLDQRTLADSKIRQLQADLSAMQADRIAKQSRWELAKSSSIDSLPEILDDGRMKELRSKLTDLRRERAQLTATLTSAHYKVQRVDAQIAEIEQTLSKEKANLIERIQNEYEASVRQEKMTSSAYYSQSSAMAGQAGKAIQHELLKRDVEMARQVYNNLLQQANQANIIAALPTNNIRIIEQSGINGVPSRPRPARDIPLGSALAVGLTCAVVTLLEVLKAKRMAKVFSSPGVISASLRLPELGAIPTLGSAPLGKVRRLGYKHLVLEGQRDTVAPKELIAWSDRTSFSADSIRYALTSLLGGITPPQLVVVTSPGPQEGKTTLSANLAAAAAAAGRKTLLIDADVRRARLHHLFGMPLDPGLTELLTTDKLTTSLLPNEYIRQTYIPGLYVLTAGSLQPGESAAEILFAAQLAETLRSLRSTFNLILIDTAPAMHFPDARLLGQLSDGVVVVVRSSVTLRQNVMSVALRFQLDRVRILGTILNDWAPSSTADQQYYSSYYNSEKAQ